MRVEANPKTPAEMGRKGGTVRAQRMTKAQRVAGAKLAARARWSKKRRAA